MPIAEHKPLYHGPTVIQGQVKRSDLLHVKGGHGKVSAVHGARAALGERQPVRMSSSSKVRFKKARRAFL